MNSMARKNSNQRQKQKIRNWEREVFGYRAVEEEKESGVVR